MASRVWQAGVVVAVLGLVGCASGNGTYSHDPDVLGLERVRVARRARVEPQEPRREARRRRHDAHRDVLGRGAGERQLGVQPLLRQRAGGIGTPVRRPARLDDDGVRPGRVMEQETLYLASLQAATSYTTRYQYTRGRYERCAQPLR